MILPILATIFVLATLVDAVLAVFPQYYSRAYDVACGITRLVVVLSGAGSLIAAIWRFLV